jgi:transposase
MIIGRRWVDCPKAYGPHKTIYNRFARWSERGIWQKIFESPLAEFVYHIISREY